MTVQIAPGGWFDRILGWFGKRRAVRLDRVASKGPTGLDVYALAPREPFWRALLRPRGARPPDGYAHPPDHGDP